MHIHPVFHVSLLEPHVANPFPGRIESIPLPIQVDGLPEFEVREILDSWIRRKKIQYLVDWVGYDYLKDLGSLLQIFPMPSLQ